MKKVLPIIGDNTLTGAFVVNNIKSYDIQFIYNYVTLETETIKYTPLTTLFSSINGRILTLIDEDGYDVLSFDYGRNIDGNEVEITIDNSTISVMVLNTALSTLDISLFKSSAEKNRVDKTDYLESVGVLSGTLRTNCNIINPVLTIEYETLPDFNYVYIINFNRWYFVEGITSLNKNLWSISMSIDVLYTYKDDILQQRGLVSRQQFEHNDMLIDKQLITTNNPLYYYEVLDNDFFDTETGFFTDYKYVLTVVD